MAYPFESSIKLTDIACQLIFSSGTTYIEESSSNVLDFYISSTLEMRLNSSGLTLFSGSTVDTIESILTNDSTHIATSAAIHTAIAAVSAPNYGSTTQIPYMNVAGDGFLYSSYLIFDGAKLVVTGASDETLKIVENSAAGSPYISFYQTTTRRGFIQYHDTGDILKIVSEYGPVELYHGVAGTETKKFETTADGAKITGKLEVTGNVGIGTSSPTALLGDGGRVLHITAPSSGNDNPEIVLERTTTGQTAKASLRITDTKDFKIAVKDGVASTIDAFTILSDTGNVGIGTSSPEEKLHVAGNMVLGIDQTYNIIRTVHAGAAIQLGAHSASWDRNLHLGFVDNSAVFSKVLSIIHQTGNVGIGISTPTNLLHISSISDGSKMLAQTYISTVNKYTGLLFKVSANADDAYKKGGILFERTGSGTGKLHLVNDIVADSGNAVLSDAKLTITDTGAVELNHNTSKKFETTSSGTTTTGIATNKGIRVTSGTTDWSHISRYTTNDSSSFYIQKEGTTSGEDFITRFNYGSQTAGGGTAALAVSSYGITASYLGTEKFRTTSVGATMTGSLIVNDDTSGALQFVATFDQNHLTANGIRVNIDAASGVTYTLFEGYRDAIKIAELRSDGDWWAADYILSSDFYLKDVYKTVTDLDTVLKLNPVAYRWKDHRDDYIHTGFVAQEVQKFYPELVKRGGDGFLSLSYGKMSTLAIIGVQGLNQKVDSIENKLRRKIKKLESRLKKVENG